MSALICFPKKHSVSWASQAAATVGRSFCLIEPTAGQAIFQNKNGWVETEELRKARRDMQIIQDPYSSLNPA